MALAAAVLVNPLRNSHAASTPAPHPTALLYGANMALFDGHDQVLLNAGTQQLLKQQGMRIIRMPFRSSLPDSVEVQAMRAIKNIGAAPLIIVRGAVDANVTQDDLHEIQLAQSVFGSSVVYVEFGNEEDLAGINVTKYTAAWNVTVPKLKAIAPTYKFIGPVNFQYNPSYIATFDKNASPRPDFNSWHEYVCNTSESDSYCLTHIANWSTHVLLTNQAVQAAIGTTLPIMITEWNLDPQQDPRYSNSAFMRQWTQAALNMLSANTAYGVVAATQYCATNNQGFNLIDGSNQPTAQGQTLFAALAQVNKANGVTPPPTAPTAGTTSVVPPQATASTSAAPPVSATPATSAPASAPTASATPAPSSAAIASGGDRTLFTFGDGATHGWESHGAQIVGLRAVNTGAGGSSALEMRLSQLTAQTYPYVSVRTHLDVSTGSTITFSIYVPSTMAGVQVRPYMMTDTYQWVGSNRYQALKAGWNQVTISAPASLNGATIQLGIQVMAPPGAVVSGALDIHSVSLTH
jgi:hypothetical protein